MSDLRDGFRGVLLQYFCEMPRAYLKLVEVIGMSRLRQVDNPIIKEKYSIYLIDYSDDTNNIEGVLSNEKRFDIFKGH